MRREHGTILTEVLAAVAHCHDHDQLHITTMAARANVPHDRLKLYLGELADADLVWREWPHGVTPKGRQLLECYHAWLRLQVLFGLSRPDRDAPNPMAPAMLTATQ